MLFNPFDASLHALQCPSTRHCTPFDTLQCIIARPLTPFDASSHALRHPSTRHCAPLCASHWVATFYCFIVASIPQLQDTFPIRAHNDTVHSPTAPTLLIPIIYLITRTYPAYCLCTNHAPTHVHAHSDAAPCPWLQWPQHASFDVHSSFFYFVSDFPGNVPHVSPLQGNGAHPIDMWDRMY